jgi:hypothetical protein
VQYPRFLRFTFYLAFAPLVLGQDLPKRDLFLGYSYIHAFAADINFSGWNASAGQNLNSWLSAEVDASGLYHAGLAPNAFPVPFDSAIHTFAAGPQIYLRGFHRVTPFFRPGLGYIHQSITISQRQSNATDYGLFYGAGGGCDLEIHRSFALRITADYARTHLFDMPKNNVRVSLGLVLRVGSHK